LIAPSIEQKRAPIDPTKLEAYDAFTPIMTSRCEQTAKCIHLMRVELGKRPPIFAALKKILTTRTSHLN
jgi:hypothetical protein